MINVLWFRDPGMSQLGAPGSASLTKLELTCQLGLHSSQIFFFQVIFY